ncbi:MAG: helix-turn-helix transcriptional regulator [Tissierella sp.]|nr:helix-turn-helix transcriptional regulator [Tissierella sp.]
MPYNKLWKLLIDKEMNKVSLKDGAGFTLSTLSKLSNKKSVSMGI